MLDPNMLIAARIAQNPQGAFGDAATRMVQPDVDRLLKLVGTPAPVQKRTLGKGQGWFMTLAPLVAKLLGASDQDVHGFLQSYGSGIQNQQDSDFAAQQAQREAQLNAAKLALQFKQHDADRLDSMGERIATGNLQNKMMLMKHKLDMEGDATASEANLRRQLELEAQKTMMDPIKGASEKMNALSILQSLGKYNPKSPMEVVNKAQGGWKAQAGQEKVQQDWVKVGNDTKKTDALVSKYLESKNLTAAQNTLLQNRLRDFPDEFKLQKARAEAQIEKIKEEADKAKRWQPSAGKGGGTGSGGIKPMTASQILAARREARIRLQPIYKQSIEANQKAISKLQSQIDMISRSGFPGWEMIAKDLSQRRDAIKLDLDRLTKEYFDRVENSAQDITRPLRGTDPVKPTMGAAPTGDIGTGRGVTKPGWKG